MIAFILNRPKTSLLLSVLIVLACLPGLINTKQNYSYRNWFNEEDPILITQDNFEKEFGSLDIVNILINFDRPLFNQQDLQLIRDITAELHEIPYTTRVDSLTNTNIIYADEDDIIIEELIPENSEIDDIKLIESRAMADPILKENFIFDNQKSTLLNYRFVRKSGQTSFYLMMLDELEKVMDAKDSIQSYHLLGNPKITTAFRISAMKDLKVLLPVLLLLIAVLIMVQFRSLQIVFFNFLTIILSIVVMIGIMTYLGITFNNLTSIAPELVLAIGLADAIHIIATYSLKLKELGHKPALQFSMEKNFIPTIVTSLTTACGFLAFTNSETNYLIDLGIVAALGTVIAWFATYFFLAPLLLLSQPKIKPNKAHFDAQKFMTFLLKNKKYIYGIYSILVLIAVVLIPKLEINSDPVNYFRGKLDFSKDIKVAEEKMKGIFPFEIVIESQAPEGIKSPDFLNEVQSFRDWVYTTETVFQDISVIKIIKKMHQVFNQDKEDAYIIPQSSELIAQLLFTYNLSVPEGRNLNDRVTLDEKKLRLTFMTKHLDSKNGNEFYRKIEAEAKKRNLNVTLTGKRFLWHSLNEKVVFSFIKSLGMALFLVSIILTFVLKSFKLGLLSLIPNLIPIVSGSIFLTILSRPLDIGSSIVASIVLGIAVDDTIHVMTNYKKYLNQLVDPKEALVKLFSETAPALIITTLILSISFACFMLASFIPNQNMGILMSMSLLFALICDLTLLPLILFDMVKKDKHASS